MMQAPQDMTKSPARHPLLVVVTLAAGVLTLVLCLGMLIDFILPPAGTVTPPDGTMWRAAIKPFLMFFLLLLPALLTLAPAILCLLRLRAASVAGTAVSVLGALYAVGILVIIQSH